VVPPLCLQRQYYAELKWKTGGIGLRILIVNNVLRESRYRRQTKKLSVQVARHCKANVRTVFFRNFDQGYLNESVAKFDAVVLGGTEALLSRARDRAQFSELIDAIKEIKIPILGICGGEQLIGLAYGKRIVPTGRFIKGFRNIEIMEDDQLLDGLPRFVSVMQSHYEMVQSVPVNFKLLARSNISPVEAFRTSARPSYSVQFHPEFSDKQHPAGARMLANFGRLAKR